MMITMIGRQVADSEMVALLSIHFYDKINFSGATPSAPPKFPSGESASFSSSQERELIDGEGVDGTETAQLYASTPRGSRRANGGGGSARYKSRPITDYSEGELIEMNWIL